MFPEISSIYLKTLNYSLNVIIVMCVQINTFSYAATESKDSLYSLHEEVNKSFFWKNKEGKLVPRTSKKEKTTTIINSFEEIFKKMDKNTKDIAQDPHTLDDPFKLDPIKLDGLSSRARIYLISHLTDIAKGWKIDIPFSLNDIHFHLTLNASDDQPGQAELSSLGAYTQIVSFFANENSLAYAKKLIESRKQKEAATSSTIYYPQNKNLGSIVLKQKTGDRKKILNLDLLNVLFDFEVARRLHTKDRWKDLPLASALIGILELASEKSDTFQKYLGKSATNADVERHQHPFKSSPKSQAKTDVSRKNAISKILLGSRLGEFIAADQKTLKDKIAEVEQAERKLENAEQRLKSLKKKSSKAKLEVKTAKETLEKEEKDLEEIKKKSRRIQLKALEKEILDLEANIKKHDSTIKKTNDEIKLLEQDLEKKKGVLQKQQRKSQKAKDDVNDAQNKLNKKKEELIKPEDQKKLYEDESQTKKDKYNEILEKLRHDIKKLYYDYFGGESESDNETNETETVSSASQVAQGIPQKPKELSPDVAAAQAKAKALYGQDEGFESATDRVMKTKDGQRFLYLNIRGGGNCGFYASGVDRATFVKTIEELVNQNHDQYQAFLKERTALATDIPNLMLAHDKTAIAARVQKLVSNSDNSGTVAHALELLTEFDNQKKTYHTELFTDARSDLIRNLQELEGLSAVKSKKELKTQIEEFVAILATASVEAFNVKDFTDQFNALVGAKQPDYFFNELVKVCGYGDVKLFEMAKLKLMNTIQNLTTLSSYEAFLTALQKELSDSGVNAADITDKEKLLKSVEKVFSQNRGVRTWIPGGLLDPIMKRLKKEYNLWASDGLDFIQLFSTSSSISGVPAKGENVRNLFFPGGHYDMLIPIDE